ncbi:MAG: hypothetical protein MUE41_14260, partial [Gemmatimonadaceae bacterium]|nr:hypothetical protein [Gemmatimonadaceae bacterium]
MSDTRLAAGEVQRRLLVDLPPPAVERHPLIAAIAGRVAGADVRSRIDVPMVRNAAMDGYAVRADDVRGATREAPVSLQVIGTSSAGA